MRNPSRPAGLIIVAGTALLLGASWARAGLTPEQKCQAGKNQVAGKYAVCRENAAAKFARKPDAARYATDLASCAVKFAAAWQKLEVNTAKTDAMCLDGKSTADAFRAVIDACTNDVVAALAGGTPPECPIALGNCQGDLAACQASASSTLLETGQTTCYDAAGAVLPSCTNSGQDAEFQKGIARSYTDGGDGTITDNRTGLVWEKLAADGGLHDQDAVYTWAEAFGKIAQLNTPSCFAGHCDWRLPNVNELHSIVDYGRSSPMVHTVFNTHCTLGCAVTACSCTASAAYWSSTTNTDDPTNAWLVLFDLGYVVIDVKAESSNSVRAVRGGS